MSVLAWLFLRGGESIRIVRDPRSFLLKIEGPGYEREVHAFKDEAQMIEFQRDYEGRLAVEGWVLAASHERRSGVDRRGDPRGPDRRRKN